MLVTVVMNGALAGPSSHSKLSGVFDLSNLELCDIYCTLKHWWLKPSNIIKYLFDPTKVILYLIGRLNNGLWLYNIHKDLHAYV